MVIEVVRVWFGCIGRSHVVVEEVVVRMHRTCHSRCCVAVVGVSGGAGGAMSPFAHVCEGGGGAEVFE